MEAHLCVLPFLSCTHVWMHVWIDAYAHTHTQTKIPSSRRVKRAIWGNAWKVSRQMIPAVCNRAITTWSCFTNLKYKSFHHRWVWFHLGVCGLLLVHACVRMYLGLCVVFLPVLLSINAISCYTERERERESREMNNPPSRDEWIEEGRGEPTRRNMGGFTVIWTSSTTEWIWRTAL